MNVLIVHQNFPGQFPHIADALIARGDRLAAIGGPMARARPGVDLRRWSYGRGSTEGIFNAATRAEADLIRAEAAALQASRLRADGFTPDVIIGHPGWGETIHLKEVWPSAKVILFGELYYRARGGDTNFDPEFAQPSLAETMRVNAKNATQALAYVSADVIVSPTKWQAGTFPPALRTNQRVLHEGVDLSRARRRAGATVTTPGGRVLDGSRPVVTFVNRTLEPLRGFHIFMRALPAFLEAAPDAEVLVIGQEARSGYGLQAPDGQTWKAFMLAELGDRLDRSRVHFMGTVPYARLIDAFSISWAHVYYTYPFALSWSLIEAMACECLVIASDTPPPHDAITNGKEGLFVPFFDVPALSSTLLRAVGEQDAFAEMRQVARERALAFDRRHGVRGWLDLIDRYA